MSVFREGVSTGHHQGSPVLQLPQPLSSLVQGNASSGEFSHHPACCCLHALHSALSRDVLCQAAGRLTRRCLTNCRAGAIKRNKAVLLLITKIKTKKGYLSTTRIPDMLGRIYFYLNKMKTKRLSNHMSSYFIDNRT